MKKSQLLTMIFVLTALCAVDGRELSRSLREAQKLYERGHYEEAAKKAYEYYKFYPDDVQAMIICGMSEFHARKLHRINRHVCVGKSKTA